MFERLMDADAELRKKYEEARADVLEELGLLLKKYYCNGRVLGRVKWTNAVDNREYENETSRRLSTARCYVRGQVRQSISCGDAWCRAYTKT